MNKIRAVILMVIGLYIFATTVFACQITTKNEADMSYLIAETKLKEKEVKEVIKPNNVEELKEYVFSTKTMYASINNLNIMKFADENSEVIATVSLNTELEVVEDFYLNGWYRIIYNDMECYVYKNVSDEKIERQLLGIYKISHYCNCSICCLKTNGITASGTKATVGRTIACNSLPFGTKVIINGKEYIVEDRGGALDGKKIDMYVSSHEEALQKGVYYTEVYLAN